MEGKSRNSHLTIENKLMITGEGNGGMGKIGVGD